MTKNRMGTDPAKLKRVHVRVAALVQESHAGSVYAAARDIGCNYDPLLRIVNGSLRRTPNLDVMLAVAKFYNKPLEYFYADA